MTIRRTSKFTLSGVALGAGTLLIGSGTALAGHEHFVVTPNDRCHQVAAGQTDIDDPEHGGYHRFHDNVHVGATERSNRFLGMGNSPVVVVKDECP